MIDAAERDGLIKEGTTIVEPSLDSPNRKRESACRKPLFYRDTRYQRGKLSDNCVTRSRRITASLRKMRAERDFRGESVIFPAVLALARILHSPMLICSSAKALSTVLLVSVKRNYNRIQGFRQ